MRRTPKLTARFIDRRRALGANSGPAALALARTIVALTRDELPGPGDVATMVPPVVTLHARRVRGFNLWVLYRFDDLSVVAVLLTGKPPVPVDG